MKQLVQMRTKVDARRRHGIKVIDRLSVTLIVQKFSEFLGMGLCDVQQTAQTQQSHPSKIGCRIASLLDANKKIFRSFKDNTELEFV